MISSTILIAKMRANGNKRPIITYQEAKKLGLPLPVACAVLEQESNGGQNVFGHDGTIFIGAGTVTKAKYLAYKKLRDTVKKYQGVGCMQLTWGGYQDEADAIGGCWVPRFNIRIGFQILAKAKPGKTWQEVFTEYNGSATYGVQVSTKVQKWAKILGIPVTTN